MKWLWICYLSAIIAISVFRIGCRSYWVPPEKAMGYIYNVTTRAEFRATTLFDKD